MEYSRESGEASLVRRASAVCLSHRASKRLREFLEVPEIVREGHAEQLAMYPLIRRTAAAYRVEAGDPQAVAKHRNKVPVKLAGEDPQLLDAVPQLGQIVGIDDGQKQHGAYLMDNGAVERHVFDNHREPAAVEVLVEVGAKRLEMHLNTVERGCLNGCRTHHFSYRQNACVR